MYNFMPESKFKNSTWYDFVNDNITKDVTQNIVYNSVVKSIDKLLTDEQITGYNKT